MPLIDKPFKRVAIDLVGPICHLSGDSHRYILTLVDFATFVGEVLVDIFSRLGVPEEILTDLGTQFVSECLKEVARLLSIKKLTTTSYPMCNGLAEKYNGTMKSMLKRLCASNRDSGVVISTRSCFHIVKFLVLRRLSCCMEELSQGQCSLLKSSGRKNWKEPEVKNSYQYVYELREKLEDTLKIAHTELQKAQHKGKHYYDRKA